MSLVKLMYENSDLFVTSQQPTAAQFNTRLTLPQAELVKRFAPFAGHYALPTLAIDGTKVNFTGVDAICSGVRLYGDSFIEFTGKAAGSYYLLIGSDGECTASLTLDAAKLNVGSVAWNGSTTLSALTNTAVLGMTIVGVSNGAVTTLHFVGAHANGVNYGVDTVVSKTASGITSSYVCILAHLSEAGNAPATVGGASYWALLASGSAGTAGASARPPTQRGVWLTGTTYNYALTQREWVQAADNKVYECKVTHVADAATEPGTGGSWTDKWALVMDPPDGATGAAGLGFQHVGTWSSASVSYARTASLADLVAHNDAVYECLLSNTSAAGNEPGTVGGSTYWRLFVTNVPASIDLHWLDDHTFAPSNAYSVGDAYYQPGSTTVQGGAVRCIQAIASATNDDKPFFGANWEDSWNVLSRDGATGTPGEDVTPVGDWSDAEQYYANDLVRHADASWIATADNLDSEPAAENTDWQLLVNDGSVGPIGPAGLGNTVHTASLPLNGANALLVGARAFVRIPSHMNGWKITGVGCDCITPSSANIIEIDIIRGNVSFLTTTITMGALEIHHSQISPPVINTAGIANVVNTNDLIEAYCLGTDADARYVSAWVTFTAP